MDKVSYAPGLLVASLGVTIVICGKNYKHRVNYHTNNVCDALPTIKDGVWIKCG